MKWILNHPVTLTMCIAFTLMLGFFSFAKLPRQLLARGFVSPYIYVSVSGFQLSPEVADKKIGGPLSGLMKTIKGLEEVTASSNRSNVWFNLKLRDGAYLPSANVELQGLLERAKSILPANSITRIMRWNPDRSPVLWAGFQVLDKENLREGIQYFEDRLQPRLERLSGVAKVDIFGFPRQVIEVRLNENQLAVYKIRAVDVLAALESAQYRIMPGHLNEMSINIQREMKSLQDIRDIYVRDGIRVADIATVREKPFQKKRIVRVNGEIFYWISINKTDDANLLTLTNSVVDEFKEIEKMLPDKFRFHVFWNEGEKVEEALAIIGKTVFFAGLIATLVVWFFLRSPRMTIISSLSIPLSMLVTLVWLYFKGESLNILSMMGLIIVAGMVVDNCIVVIEAIGVRVEEGKSLDNAILMGVSDVGLPVCMATLTTIAVFLPLIFLGGNGRFAFFMEKLGVPVCVALLASLFIAIVIVPFLIKSSSRSSKVNHQSTSTLMKKMQGVYSYLLYRVLKNRFEVGVLLLLFAVGTFYLQEQFPAIERHEDETKMSFSVDFDQAIDFTRRNEILKVVEKVIEERRQLYGIKSVSVRLHRSSCCASVKLSRFVETKLSNKSLRKELDSALPVLAGVVYDVNSQGVRISEQNWSKFEESFHILGLDSNMLSRLRSQIIERIEVLPGVESVGVPRPKVTTRNFELKPIKERMEHYSLLPDELIASMRARMQSFDVFRIDDSIPVRLESQVVVETAEQLVSIEAKPGVPIGQVTSLTYAPAEEHALRLNGVLEQSFRVIFDKELDDTALGVIKEKVSKEVDSFVLPGGYMMTSQTFRAKKRK